MMKTSIEKRQAGLWVVVIAIVGALGFWSLQGGGPAESATTGAGKPVTIEKIDGTPMLVSSSPLPPMRRRRCRPRASIGRHRHRSR